MMKRCHVHNLPPGNVYCSLRPSADGAHAKMPRDPIWDGNISRRKRSQEYTPDGTFATRTSMMHKMKTVHPNQNATTRTRMIVPKTPELPQALAIVIDHSTSDS